MPTQDRKTKVRTGGDRWFVYLLRCADGSLYTGIAKDLNRRCGQHNAGTASRYTRSRLPVELVYQEAHGSRSLALKREAAIKAMTRRRKETLIAEARNAQRVLRRAKRLTTGEGRTPVPSVRGRSLHRPSSP